MTDEELYNVNFFKPKSGHAKANTKLILILATIWAVGVFGFQILLMITTEPTPEPAYAMFEDSWAVISENPDAPMEVKREFAHSLLFVLGKNIAVSDAEKAILKEALSTTVYSMLPGEEAAVMTAQPAEAAYAAAKDVLQLKDDGFDKIKADLIPFSLVQVSSAELSPEVSNKLPGIMSLYLIHNRSGLTDTTFLGFPFHEFTASGEDLKSGRRFTNVQ